MTIIRTRLAACVLSGVVLLGLTGCGFRDRGPAAEDLPPEVQKAIDDVVAQFTPAAEALAAVFDGFEGIDLDGDGQFGDCPEGTVSVEGGVFTITLDYGDGCTNENEYYGTDQASGRVTLFYDSNTQSVSIEYIDLRIEDRAVDGSLDLQFASDGSFRTLVGSIDLTTDSGSVAGTLNVRFGLLLNSITINSATLTLADTEQTSFTITIDSLVIKPVANESFIPESGTMTFEVPNDGPGPDTLTVVVTFSNGSPVDGTVSVTVGGAPGVTYRIPGVG